MIDDSPMIHHQLFNIIDDSPMSNPIFIHQSCIIHPFNQTCTHSFAHTGAQPKVRAANRKELYSLSTQFEALARRLRKRSADGPLQPLANGKGQT